MVNKHRVAGVFICVESLVLDKHSEECSGLGCGEEDMGVSSVNPRIPG